PDFSSFINGDFYMGGCTGITNLTLNMQHGSIELEANSLTSIVCNTMVDGSVIGITSEYNLTNLTLNGLTTLPDFDITDAPFLATISMNSLISGSLDFF